MNTDPYAATFAGQPLLTPQPATPGIMTTQFIHASQYPEVFDKEGWLVRYKALMKEREGGQTAEEYANLHYEPDSRQWLIAFAAFEAGSKA